MKTFDNVFFRIFGKIKVIFINKPHNNWKNYPVIINNYNRLEMLLKLIAWLEKAGMKKIYIIDNNSTYKPLLEFYKLTKYTVFRLDKNVGHLSLWKTHIFKWFENTYYVYTDPDVIPIEKCPTDAVNYFKILLDKYSKIKKVGFGLKIDDLPDYYPLKEKVIKWEKKFWEVELEKDVYLADIDTTFALYKPNVKRISSGYSIRTGKNYIARHLPWYIDYNKLDEEELYYFNNTTNVSSWNAAIKGKTTQYL